MTKKAVARSRSPALGIERSIHVMRGHRVMLDVDLAKIYGVPTKRLNEAVKRNLRRFPADFMFALSAEEAASLRSQIATSKTEGRGGRRYLPRVFTEQGIAMLSTVLNSERAIAVNIEIMRVFVRLRHAITVNAELAHRLAAVEANLSEHRTATGGKLAEHEQRIAAIIDAIQQLIGDGEQPEPPPMGFELGRKK